MQEVRNIILALQAENKLTDSYVKVIISAQLQNDEVQPVLTVYQDPFKPYPPSMFTEGIALLLREFSKPFPEFKTTFYMGSLREYRRMKENNAEDVLFYADNNVRECARCNIFIVKNNMIYTPAGQILKGVTRKHVMRCAGDHYFVIENNFSTAELFDADEIFITSTTRNIMPVARIEDRSFGSPGPVTGHLITLFDDYCKAYAD
jgi:branched-subunit amino acid aminotransferase/4-amino-4-deoxychorismate lyase